MKIISLKKDQEVVEEITKYINQNNIESGLVIGLGALSQAELMLYDLGSKEYISKTIQGPLEVGSFHGIIARDPQENHHVHPHIVLSDKDFSTYCGHLKRGVVGATLELVFFESDQKITRYEDSEIGLNLIK